MSTRCQVILTDGRQRLWYYRHCDGYPSGVKKTLDKFCKMLKEGKIRSNVEQGGGWLVVLGRNEYARVRRESKKAGYTGSDWQVGAYEPCACAAPHGDIEYLYEVDMTRACWREVPKGEWPTAR